MDYNRLKSKSESPIQYHVYDQKPFSFNLIPCELWGNNLHLEDIRLNVGFHLLNHLGIFFKKKKKSLYSIFLLFILWKRNYQCAITSHLIVSFLQEICTRNGWMFSIVCLGVNWFLIHVCKWRLCVIFLFWCAFIYFVCYLDFYCLTNFMFFFHIPSLALLHSLTVFISPMTDIGHETLSSTLQHSSDEKSMHLCNKKKNTTHVNTVVLQLSWDSVFRWPCKL